MPGLTIRVRAHDIPSRRSTHVDSGLAPHETPAGRPAVYFFLNRSCWKADFHTKSGCVVGKRDLGAVQIHDRRDEAQS